MHTLSVIGATLLINVLSLKCHQQGYYISAVDFVNGAQRKKELSFQTQSYNKEMGKGATVAHQYITACMIEM